MKTNSIIDKAIDKLENNLLYKIILNPFKYFDLSNNDGCIITLVKLILGLIGFVLISAYFPISLIILIVLWILLIFLIPLFLVIYYILQIILIENPFNYLYNFFIINRLKIYHKSLINKLFKSKTTLIKFEKSKIIKYNNKNENIINLINEIKLIEQEIHNNNKVQEILRYLKYNKTIFYKDLLTIKNSYIEIFSLKNSVKDIENILSKIVNDSYITLNYSDSNFNLFEIVTIIKDVFIFEKYLTPNDLEKFKISIIKSFTKKINKNTNYNDIKDSKSFFIKEKKLLLSLKVQEHIIKNLLNYNNLKIENVENIYNLIKNKFINKTELTKFFKENMISNDNLLTKLLSIYDEKNNFIKTAELTKFFKENIGSDDNSLAKLLSINNEKNNVILNFLNLYSTTLEEEFVETIKLRHYNKLIYNFKEKVYSLNFIELEKIISNIQYNKQDVEKNRLIIDEYNFVKLYQIQNTFEIKKVNIFSNKSQTFPDVFFSKYPSVIKRPTKFKSNLLILESFFTEKLIESFGDIFLITNTLNIDSHIKNFNLGIILFHKKLTNLAINIYIVEENNKEINENNNFLRSVGYNVIVFEKFQILNNLNKCIDFIKVFLKYIIEDDFFPQNSQMYITESYPKNEIEYLREIYKNINFDVYLNFDIKLYLNNFYEKSNEIESSYIIDDSDKIMDLELIEFEGETILIGNRYKNNVETVFYNFYENKIDSLSRDENFTILKSNIKRKADIYKTDTVENLKKNLFELANRSNFIRLEYENYAHSYRTISNIKPINGNVSINKINEYKLNNKDYFYAFCYKNNEYRVFKFSRVLSVEPLDY